MEMSPAYESQGAEKCTRYPTICVRKELTFYGRIHKNLSTVNLCLGWEVDFSCFRFFYTFWCFGVYLFKKIYPNQLPAIKNEDSPQKELDFQLLFKNWNMRHYWAHTVAGNDELKLSCFRGPCSSGFSCTPAVSLIYWSAWPLWAFGIWEP